MGLRFRKSFRIFPGVRINLSRTGIGASIGFKGFRLTKRADGKVQRTVSLPGTGISYVSVGSEPAASKPKPKAKSKAQARPKGKTCAVCGQVNTDVAAKFCNGCGLVLA